MNQPRHLRRWHVLTSIIRSEGFKTFVEVGAKEGRTSGFVLEQCPDCYVIAMDPWQKRPEQADKECGETYEEWDFPAIKKEFMRNVRAHKSRIVFYKNKSADVAPLIQDESQDIVFIDAAHDYDSVLEDIRLWLPKVRKGGILSGHDYQPRFPSVVRAVDESFGKERVRTGSDAVWWVRKT